MIPISSLKYPASIATILAILLSVACTDSTDTQDPSTSVAGSDTQDALAWINISNPSDQQRIDQSLFVDLDLLGISSGDTTESLVFQMAEEYDPSQLVDLDGDGSKDHALLVMDLAPAEMVRLDLIKSTTPVDPPAARTHAEIGVKVGGHWEEQLYVGDVFQDVESVTPPEQYTDHSEYIRYEGPGIESDKVGYRVYLDWRNGFDIFAKAEYGLHLSNVGLDGYDSYHELSDWGMDVLKVGDAVGIGGFGIWRDGAIERVSDVQQHSARIIEDGPLYSAFAIDYLGWNTGAEVVDLTAQLAMVAGSSLVKVDINTATSIDQLAIGIVKHEETQLLQGSIDITGEAWSYIATLGPQSLDGRSLAMFILFQREDFSDYIEDELNQAVLLALSNGKLQYYFGSQWAGEPGADLSEPAVTAMLEEQVQRLTMPPRVQIENQISQNLKQQLGGSSSALVWSERAAASEINRHGMELAYGSYDSMRERAANWEYTTGLLTQAIYQLGIASTEKKYQDWSKAIIDSYIEDDGQIRTYDRESFNIDSINSGKMLLQLYRDTGEQKYRLAAEALRAQLIDHPRLDEGAFWHKQRYPYQLWLDGVYMGIPFLVEYSLLFEEGESLEEALQEFQVVRDKLRDPETGLYFHAWDEKQQQEWADPATGLSHYFWGRGMGWLSMALVDTYELLPESESEMRAELQAMIQDLADTLLQYRDDQGVWHQIVDMKGKTANYQESSASAMFTYLLVKGVITGALPESYRDAALSSYDSLVNQFVLVDTQGAISLTQACQVGGLGFGRDGSYQYYMSEPVVENDPKVLGPFIMLGPLVSKI